jgi:hypothetical protein
MAQFWRKSRTAYITENEELIPWLVKKGAYTPASQVSHPPHPSLAKAHP